MSLTVTDNGNGTALLAGTDVTDNGDGTLTLTGSGIVDNGDGTLSLSNTAGGLTWHALVLNVEDIEGHNLAGATVFVSYDRTVRSTTVGLIPPPAAEGIPIPVVGDATVNVLASNDPTLTADSQGFGIKVRIVWADPSNGWQKQSKTYFAQVLADDPDTVNLSDKIGAQPVQTGTVTVNPSQLLQAISDAAEAKTAAADAVVLAGDANASTNSAVATYVTAAGSTQTALDGRYLLGATATANYLKKADAATQYLTQTAAASLVAQTRKINGHALTADVTVSATDITTGQLPVAQTPSQSAGGPMTGALPAISAASLTGTATALTGSTFTCKPNRGGYITLMCTLWCSVSMGATATFNATGTGTTLTDETLAGWADTNGRAKTIAWTFPVTAGTTYTIAVTGKIAGTGATGVVASYSGGMWAYAEGA